MWYLAVIAEGDTVGFAIKNGIIVDTGLKLDDWIGATVKEFHAMIKREGWEVHRIARG